MDTTPIREIAACLAQTAVDAISPEHGAVSRSHWIVAVSAAHRSALHQLRRGCEPATARLPAVTAARRALRAGR